VAEKNIQINITATGTRHLPNPKAEGQPAQSTFSQAIQDVLALPPPEGKENYRKNTRDGSSRNIVLQFMARHPKDRFTVTMLRALHTQSYFSPNTTANVIFVLRRDKLIRKLPGRGKGYRITPKGLKHVEELG
jgi:uncharacterized protein YjhX (UPF0386 family)